MSLATLWTLRLALMTGITMLAGCNLVSAFAGNFAAIANIAPYTLLLIGSLAAIERLAMLAGIPGAIRPAPRLALPQAS